MSEVKSDAGDPWVGGSNDVMCGGACIDLLSDPNHCGTCTTACNTGQVCNLGRCSTVCSGSLTACNGACVDTTSDSVNCGSCGQACSSTRICSAGACACSQPAISCSGTCVDTS